MIEQLAHLFQQGGIWMYPILAAQIVSIALIVDRVRALYTARIPDARNRVRQFEEDIKKGQLDRVIMKTEGRGDEVISLLARAGAESALQSSGKEEIQLKMEELVMEETSRIEKRIGFLAVIANVATLLGLLGTIVGLIESFSAISGVSGAEKAKLLASGVSVAMNATAYGLIVAVPALVMYAILQNRANSLVDDLNKAALRLYIWFGFNVETPVSKKKA